MLTGSKPSSIFLEHYKNTHTHIYIYFFFFWCLVSTENVSEPHECKVMCLSRTFLNADFRQALHDCHDFRHNYKLLEHFRDFPEEKPFPVLE